MYITSAITHLYGFPGLILKFGERLNREVSPYVSAPSILCLPPWLKYLTQYHIFNYPQLIFPMRIIKFLTSTNQVAKS